MPSFDRAARRYPGQRPWKGLRTVFRLAAAVGALLTIAPAFAQDGAADGDPSAGSPPAAPLGNDDQASRGRAPLSRDPAFARYPEYRGTLGAQRIVLRIGVKPDDPEGLNGEYEFFSGGPGADGVPVRVGTVILIAGARDGDTLTLEESDDGVRITGQWVGQYAADGSLSGERMNDDESVSTAFDLQPVPGAGRADAGHNTELQSGQGRVRPANSQGRP